MPPARRALASCCRRPPSRSEASKRWDVVRKYIQLDSTGRLAVASALGLVRHDELPGARRQGEGARKAVLLELVSEESFELAKRLGSRQKLLVEQVRGGFPRHEA